MKIGFISQPFDDCGPPVPSGSIAVLTWELARRLARSNQVVVCAPRSQHQAGSERWQGVAFNRFSLKADHRLLDWPRRLPGPLAEARKDIHSIAYCAVYALRSAVKLRAERCSVIHIHNFSQFLPIARFFNHRAKIVLHMNCDWLSQFDPGLIDSRLRHADLILGCADYITNRVKDRFPQHADRCATIYNGADILEFCHPDGRVLKRSGGPRFIFAGRVSPEKGIHVLLEAFRTVSARHREANLRVVGGVQMPPLSFIVERSRDPAVLELRQFYECDYLEYLQNQAKAVAGDHVSFTGFVSHAELAHLLHQADVFVQPSIWGEPFPLAVVEAMAAGLPVVSSRAGGLPESVIDGKTGLLVEPNNAGALANAMLRLVADGEMAENMSIAAAARARQLFSWEAVVTRLRSLYEALISGLPIKAVARVPTGTASAV